MLVCKSFRGHPTSIPDVLEGKCCEKFAIIVAFLQPLELDLQKAYLHSGSLLHLSAMEGKAN